MSRMKRKQRFDAKITATEKALEDAPPKSVALKRHLTRELELWQEARGML